MTTPNRQATASATNKKRKGRRMWTPSVSLELATRIYDGASIAFLCSLIVGVFSTALIIVMGSVKESHWEKEREASHERIAELGKETAEANKHAKEAELALEKFRAPRTLPSTKRAQFLEKLKPFSGTPFDLGESDAESIEFALIIASVLSEAGWHHIEWTIPGGILKSPYTRNMGQVPHHGVAIDIFDPNLSDAMKALVDVLETSGIERVVPALKEGAPNKQTEKTMHIMVGTKPR